MQLGADPDHLSGLARSLRDAAGRLDSLSSGLARRVRQVHWTGRDAGAFEQAWHGSHRPGLARSAAGLTELARRLDAQRQAQEAASHVGAASAGPAPADLGPAELALAGLAPADHAPRSRPAATLPPLPLVEQRFRGSLEARVGPVTGTLTGELVVQHLDGDRRRVVLTQAAGLGGVLAAGSGADVAVGGPHGAGSITSGTSADAALRGGVLERRAWVVADDEVDDLLARLVVEQAALATAHTSAPQVTLADAAGRVLGQLTGRDPQWDLGVALATAVPAPVSQEHLAEVEVAGGVAAGLGGVLGLGARAQGSMVARLGALQQGAASSTVLELHGSGTGALTSTLLRRAGVSLPTDVHRASSVRVEMPRDGDHVLVRTSVTTDEQVHDTVLRVELGGGDGPTDVAAAASATQQLRRSLLEGDATAAVSSLARLQLADTTTQVVTAEGELSGHSARAGASVAVGIGGGVTLRGHALQVDRR
jgi:uncharacterized protein YukE